MEQSDAITMLDWYMVEEVCAFLERTQAEGIKIRPVKEGKKDFHLVTRQIGDDGIYRKVETGNYFVKSPATEDILVISLCHNISE